MFQINEVVKYNEAPFRVLMQMPNHIIWIALDDALAFPQLVSKKKLEIAIDEEVLTRIEDPHAELAFQVTAHKVVVHDVKAVSITTI